jgi:hypothetical protein
MRIVAENSVCSYRRTDSKFGGLMVMEIAAGVRR